jgi:hypothetical protein
MGVVDACCDKITLLLCQHGQPTPRGLAKLVEERFSPFNVMLHLKHFEDSLLAKEEILKSRVGRPKILCKPTEKLLDGFRTQSD